MKSLLKRIILILFITTLIGSLIPQVFAGSETLQDVNISAEEKVIVWAVPTPFGEENSPQQITSDSGLSYASSIYNGLMRRTIASNHGFVPDLAVAMPEISSDSRNWTFTLREGLKFSDGSDLNASSVVFSYKVHLTKSIDVAYSTLAPYFTNSSIYEIDNLTVQFEMAKPYAFAPSLFSQWIYSEDHFGSQYDACLVDVTLSACDWNIDITGSNLQGGSGAFMVDKYETINNFIELIPNPHYYNSAQIKIDRLVIRTIEDANAAKAAFASGETNVFDSQYRAKFRDFGNLAGVTDVFVGAPGIQEMVLNHNHQYFGLGNYTTTGINAKTSIANPLENARAARNIRKAMSHMIDRVFIADEITGLSSPTATIMPNIAIGWDETILPREYNQDIAKSYMEDAGFDYSGKTFNASTGAMAEPFFEITLLSPLGNADIEQVGAIMVQELPKIGIGVKGHETGGSSTELHPRLYVYPGPPPVYDKGGYDIFFDENGYDNFNNDHNVALDWDPSGLYELENQNPECCNVYNYNNATLEGAISDYLAELDAAKRLPLVKYVQKLLYDDQPTIPIDQEYDHWAWASNVLGLDGFSMSLRSSEWELVDVNFDIQNFISRTYTVICTITCPVGYIVDNCDCVKSSTLSPPTSPSDTRTVNLNIPNMNIVLSTFVFMMVINLRVSRKRNL